MMKALKGIFKPAADLAEIIKETPLQDEWDARISTIQKERDEQAWEFKEDEEMLMDAFTMYKKVSVPASDFILLLQEVHQHVQKWLVQNIVKETVIALDSIAYLLQFSKQEGTPEEVQRFVQKASIFLEDATQPWVTQLQKMGRSTNEGVEDAFILLDVASSTSNDFVIYLPAIYVTDECMVVEEEDIPLKKLEKEKYMVYELSFMEMETFVQDFTQAITKVSKEERLQYMKDTYERSVQFAQFVKQHVDRKGKKKETDEKKSDAHEQTVTLEDVLTDFEGYFAHVDFTKVQPYEPNTPLGRLIEDVIDKEQLDEWVKEKREKATISIERD